MKYKDVSFEVLHSKKEKVRGVVLRVLPSPTHNLTDHSLQATNLFVSLGVSLCAEVEALQNLPHTDPRSDPFLQSSFRPCASRG
jgi:hypothetical protein